MAKSRLGECCDLGAVIDRLERLHESHAGDGQVVAGGLQQIARGGSHPRPGRAAATARGPCRPAANSANRAAIARSPWRTIHSAARPSTKRLVPDRHVSRSIVRCDPCQRQLQVLRIVAGAPTFDLRLWLRCIWHDSVKIVHRGRICQAGHLPHPAIMDLATMRGRNR